MPPSKKRPRDEFGGGATVNSSENNAADDAADDGPDLAPSAAGASSSPTKAPPRLQHCFVVGDLVEAMFVDNCWVAGRVVETRVRQVRVEYEKEAMDVATAMISGPRHICRHENETPRDIARAVNGGAGVPLAVLLALNAERFPDLVGNAKLKARTTLALPELHMCSEGDTPRSIARRFGRSLDDLLEQNGSSLNNLGAGTKLRHNQQVVLPPIGEDSATENGTSPATSGLSPLSSPQKGAQSEWLVPQLGELVELCRKRVTMQPMAAMTNATGGGGKASKSAKGAAAAVAVSAAAASESSSPMDIVVDGSSTSSEWVQAEVVLLIPGGGFHARLALPIEDGEQPAAAAGSKGGGKEPPPEVSEALFEGGEGSIWRRVQGSGSGGNDDDTEASEPLAVGSEIEVEVNEDSGPFCIGGRPCVRWRPAEVRALLNDGNFAVCVDGDEDFVEQYSPEEEGTEWRRRKTHIEVERRASEWTTHNMVRPRMPIAKGDFLSTSPPPATVQVCQDGGWWRASLIGPFVEPVIPSGGIAPPKPDFFLAAEQNAPQNTYLVQILERPDPQTFLKVAGTRLRPDWEWSRAGWALAQPKQMWNPLANLPDAAEEGSGDAAGGVVLSKSPRKDQGMMASSFVGEEGDGEAAAAGGGDAPQFRSLSAPPISTALVPAVIPGRADQKKGGWVFRSDLVRLPPSEIDRKLWVGSAEQGWLVVEACRNGAKNGLWRYCSPDGQAYRSKSDARERSNPVPLGNTAKRNSQGESGVAVGQRYDASGAAGTSLPPAVAPPAVDELQRIRAAQAQAAGAMAHPRQWARVGMGIEVRLPEPLFRGAWWEGELLEMTNQSAHVRIHAFAARDGCEERLDEWVPWGRTRPTPPPPPTDFLRATRFGEPVEIWWADGWWEATLVAIARPAEREKSVEEQAAAAVAAQAAAPPPAAEVVMAEAEEGVAGGEAAAAAGAPSATSPARRRSSRAIVTKEADALAPSFPPWEQTTVIVTRRSARMQRHAVHPSQLRPGWQWKGTWSAPCIAPTPPAPPPQAAPAPAAASSTTPTTGTKLDAAGLAANDAAIAAAAATRERYQPPPDTFVPVPNGLPAPALSAKASPSAERPHSLPSAYAPVPPAAKLSPGAWSNGRDGNVSPFKRAAALALRGENGH